MKKRLFPVLSMVLLLGSVAEAQAQVGSLVHLFTAGTMLTVRAVKQAKDKKNQPVPDVNSTPALAPVVPAIDPAIPRVTYRSQEFARQRTAAAELPRKGGKQVAAVETELERCHAALLADSTSAVCSLAQRGALQAALSKLSMAKPEWNLLAYQQEAAFYVAEDQRRQAGR